MDFVLWLGIDLLAGVRHDPDDRPPILAAIESDPLSDGILARPISAGQRLIDDHDDWRLPRVAGREKTSAQERLADGFEILLRADQNEAGGGSGVCLRIAMFDGEGGRIVRQPV